jgi:quercetin dioxygenase-like cupin family protein
MDAGARYTTRLKIAVGIVVMLAFASVFSVQWIARAQPEPRNDGPRFTGTSTSLGTEGLRISRRSFEPGARTAWHRHIDGQLLFVEEGRARIQRRGEATREIGVGESDYTPPNIDHWHGATPHEHFVQVAVGFGQEVEWLELVTDEEYNGGGAAQ